MLLPGQIHLKKDPIMKRLVEKHPLKEGSASQNDLLLDLVEIVTSQQLSTKVATVIFKRFLALFPGKPDPDQVLKIDIAKLRSVGLSNSKANYIKNIAQAISSGAVRLAQFEELSDDEIKNDLIKIKGIGPWSAEMFLMFSMKRPDVFSIGDLGLRIAIEKLYSINRADQKAMLVLSENWRPHRTLACRYLWASLENI